MLTHVPTGTVVALVVQRFPAVVFKTRSPPLETVRPQPWFCAPFSFEMMVEFLRATAGPFHFNHVENVIWLPAVAI